jgi:hypothetical protein
MVDEKQLKDLLKQKTETSWLEFKRKWKLFDVTGKLNETERDELVKDILGLANGNSGIVRKTKYLIIGADDTQFTADGIRVLHDVDYQVPTQSQIVTWVNSACTPSVVGIESYFLSVDMQRLYIVTVQPTFELHETTRELNAKGHHGKHTVFMRQDEHTIPASVRDGITIQQLKSLHRQEITNPPAIRFGGIFGAFVALLFWSMGYAAPKPTTDLTFVVVQVLITIVGGVLGAEVGWAFQQVNAARYDWRYIPSRNRILLLVGLAICIILWIVIRGILNI